MSKTIKKLMRFWKDENGSEAVGVVALVIIATLLAYYFYSNIKPGIVSSSGAIGGVLQQ